MGRSIEKQIFVLRNEGKSPDEKNVRRFSLRGFDFEMPIVPEEDEIEPRLLKCHVNVEMSLFSAIPYPSPIASFSTDIPGHCPRRSALTI